MCHSAVDILMVIRGKMLLPVSLIPVLHLDLRIPPEIFYKKNSNDPNIAIRSLGEKMIHEKNLKKKSRNSILLNLI
jgi:hypothetical protein